MNKEQHTIRTLPNDFGALMQIALCISEYLTKIKSSATPFLNISLSH